MQKKAINLILSGVLILGSVTAAFGTITKPTDVAGTPYETAVNNLVEAEILSGYEDNTFRPENSITRAESAVVLMKAMNPPEEILESLPSSEFTDMENSQWAQQAVDYAVAKGFVSGYPDGTFAPTKYVTYAEFTTMLVNALGYDPSEVTGSWPSNYMNKGFQLGLYNDVDTSDDERFGPNLNATRGDVALIVSPVTSHLAAEGAIAPPEKPADEKNTDGAITSEGAIQEGENTVETPTEKPGYEVTPGMAFVGDAISLSIEDTVRIMQTEGLLAQQAKLSKEADEIAAQSSTENARTLTNTLKTDYGFMIVDFPTETDLKLVRMQRDFIKANIENNYQADMNNIESTAVENYYNVLIAQEDLRIEQDNLKKAQNVLTNVKTKFDHGTASKLEVSSAEMSVTSAQTTVNAKETALIGAKMAFNTNMGYPAMQNVTFTDSLELMNAPDITLENAIKSAISNRNDIVAAQFNCEVQQILLNSLKYTTNPVSVTYKTQQRNLANAEFALNNAPKQIEAEIRGQYIALQTMMDGINAAKSGVDLAEEAFRVAQIMYEAGMNTLTDVQDAQISVYEADKALSSAISTYNLAVYDFNHAISVGTTRIPFSV